MWVIILFKKTVCIFIVISVILAFPVIAKGSNRISVSAEYACVIDSSTKQVLYNKNAGIKHSMASTTKIMTCLLACESNKLNNTVTVTDAMLKGVEGTSLYLKLGDSITIIDLVKGAMLESGNDAANVIAFAISGSIAGFVNLMNLKAAQLGMNNTHFVTPSGLDAPQHYSTAYDMALLAAYAMKNGVFSSISSKISDEIVICGIKRKLYNHNKLLSISKNYVGIKTGFTKKSGRCLVSAYYYGSSKIICVTLNAPDDWNDHKKLVKYAKKVYYSAEDTVNLSVDAVGSNKNTVLCSYSYKIKSLGKINVKLYYYPFVYTPLSSGERVGTACIYINDDLIKTVDIITDEEINNG